MGSALLTFIPRVLPLMLFSKIQIPVVAALARICARSGYGITHWSGAVYERERMGSHY